MKKIAIFTTFFEAESGYSLITVADTQIKMLLSNGYNPMVMVQDNFIEPNNSKSVWKQEIIDLRKVLPSFNLDNGISVNFESRVEAIQKILEDNLQGFDVCITHDIILQQWYKEYNIAMRNYAKKRPDLLWLHWLHSCPTPANVKEYPNNCRYSSPPGYIIYPNNTDLALVNQTYGLFGKEWKSKALRHTLDPLESLEYDKLTKDLIKKSNFYKADINIIYPIRMDKGKQPEKVIRLAAGIKLLGYNPSLLIIDWQSGGAHFQSYINELMVLASSLNLEGNVHFTSRLDDRCDQGVPRKVVNELMDLSTIYIHPSRVETYSLVVHEAMLRGKLVVLNHDFPVMRELFGDLAIYMDFGSDRNNRTYLPDEQSFWNDEAKRLIAEYKQNRALVAQSKMRKEYAPDSIWKDFESLFYLMPVGE